MQGVAHRKPISSGKAVWHQTYLIAPRIIFPGKSFSFHNISLLRIKCHDQIQILRGRHGKGLIPPPQSKVLAQCQPRFPFFRLIKPRRQFSDPVPRQVRRQTVPLPVSLCGKWALHGRVFKDGGGSLLLPLVGPSILQSHQVSLIRIQRRRMFRVVITQINGRRIDRISAVQYSLYLYLYRPRGNTVLQWRGLYNHALGQTLSVFLQLIVPGQRFIVGTLLRPAQIPGPLKIKHTVRDNIPVDRSGEIPVTHLVRKPHWLLFRSLRCLFHCADGGKNLLEPFQIIPAQLPQIPARTDKRHRECK